METTDQGSAASPSGQRGTAWIWLVVLGLSILADSSSALAATPDEPLGEGFSEAFRRSLDEARQIEPAYVPSGDVGSSLEERLSNVLGVDVELAFAPVDSRYMIDHGDRWVQSSEDVALRVRSYGPDFERAAGPGPEQYRGPIVGYQVVGSNGYYLLEERPRPDLEEDFVWSGVLEMRIPLAGSEHWSFQAGLRYMTFQVPFVSQREVRFTFGPETALIGLGLRF